MGSEYLNLSFSELKDYAKSKDIKYIKTITKKGIIKTLVKNDISNMTVSELKEYAKYNSIPFVNGNKEDLVKSIITGAADRVDFVDDDSGLLLNRDTKTLVEKSSLLNITSHKETVSDTKIIFMICDSCGQKVYGEFEEQDENVLTQKQVLKVISKCPVCKKKMPIEKAVVIDRTSKISREDIFSEIAKKQAEEQELIIKKEIEKAFVNKKKGGEKNCSSIQKIDLSIEQLKQYIKYLISFESDLYFFERRLNSLYASLFENARSQKRAEKVINDDAEKAFLIRSHSLRNQLEIIADKKIHTNDYFHFDASSIELENYGLIEPQKPSCVEPILPIEPQKPELKEVSQPLEPVYQKVGLFNKKKIEAKNEELRVQYLQALELYNNTCEMNEILKRDYDKKYLQYKEDMIQYETAINEYALEIEKYNEANEQYKENCEKQISSMKEKEWDFFLSSIRESENEINDEIANLKTQIEAETHKCFESLPHYGVQAVLNDEIALIKEEIKQVIKTRDELYAYNIIYPKYRNYVALTSIFEYLDSKRCDSLEGANGAYNIFESEVRANEIILQLNTIAISLDQIKANQSLMYQEINRVNNNLEQMDKTMSRAVTELINMRLDFKTTNYLLEQIKTDTQQNGKALTSIGSDMYTMSNDLSDTKEYAKSMAKNTKEIASNTKITAYYSGVAAHYSKINAELTDSLGFMMALK